MPDLSDQFTIPPDPDCLACDGSGVESWGDLGSHVCECTMVCKCGEERPNDIQHCAACSSVGCDACDRVEWCCDEDDYDNGDYFCTECRAE